MFNRIFALSIIFTMQVSLAFGSDFLDSEATNKFSSETPPECIKTLVEVVSNKDASALRQLLNEHFNVFLHHKNDYDIGSTFDHISNHGYLDMMKCMLISYNGEFLINKESIYWAYKYAARYGYIEVINYLLGYLPAQFLPTQDIIDCMIKDAANFQHSNVINLLLSRPK
ncbi:MAG: ankyrin repeat domain-containing protein, partial [Pseudomonadota bacterium]|nr:ankyrin repeat domain-containing protein [Pseudomonadota bacterium]